MEKIVRDMRKALEGAVLAYIIEDDEQLFTYYVRDLYLLIERLECCMVPMKDLKSYVKEKKNG